jgi:hypothetical protein
MMKRGNNMEASDWLNIGAILGAIALLVTSLLEGNLTAASVSLLALVYAANN